MSTNHVASNPMTQYTSPKDTQKNSALTEKKHLTLRARRKNETREALKNAVLQQCVIGQSFSSMSLRQVTKIAGVVPATFYRHFKDMETLGVALVNESLSIILKDLHKRLALKNERQGTEKIADSVKLFFKVVNDHPDLWRFIVTERWGGSAGIRNALKTHFSFMITALVADLKKQKTLDKISNHDLHVLAEMLANLFCGWVMGWIELAQEETEENLAMLQKEYTQQCTTQAKLIFYGVVNWQPKAN